MTWMNSLMLLLLGSGPCRPLKVAFPDDTGGEGADTEGEEPDTEGDEPDTDRQDTQCAEEWYLDADGDGFGTEASTWTGCTPPPGYAGQGGDCDDFNRDVSPEALERCDGVDEDCDGDTDEDAVDAATWYSDADGDGYGDAATAVGSCGAPPASVAEASDCDDADDGVYPGADDACDDGVDEDCDGADAICACRPEGDVYLADAHARLQGVSPDEAFGGDVVGAGDVNGDGLDDVMVGSPTRDAVYGNDGGAYLFLGPVSGDYLTSAADASVDGETYREAAGTEVEGLGDADGDGYADVALGAPGDGASMGTPRVYLLAGPLSGAGTVSDAYAVLDGEATGDRFGSAMSVGDLDGDGAEDLLVGAFFASSGSGAAYLFRGPLSADADVADADAMLTGDARDDYAGASVAADGDVDGDGVDDMLIGAWGESSAGSYTGAAYVVYGPASGEGDLSTADAKLTGEAGGDYAGSSVAHAGDVDGDGLGDVLVGAAGNGGDMVGGAYLMFGPVAGTSSLSTAPVKVAGAATSDYLGYTVAGAGDVDLDDFSDVLVAAVGADDASGQEGKTLLLYGPFSGALSYTDAGATFIGELYRDFSGEALDAAGDVDGDGFPDVLIGAGEASRYGGSGQYGMAYVLLGGCE